MHSLLAGIHGACNIETASVGVTPATSFVEARTGKLATFSAGNISQHLLVVSAAKLMGGETIPVISKCGSCFPIPGICCEQEASVARGATSSAIASAAATSLEYGVMPTQMMLSSSTPTGCDGGHRCTYSTSQFWQSGRMSYLHLAQ